MIRKFNRRQKLLAIVSLAGGVVCYFLAYLFFRYGPELAAHQFGYWWSATTSNAVAVLGLIVVSFSGYRIWKSGGGLKGYHESSFYHDLGEENGGAMMVDFYVHRITGPAHFLSQLFLAGPLLILKVATLKESLIPESAILERKLAETLSLLRDANKWQSIMDYPGLADEILYLARMKLIDFSTAKGTPRIKADLS